jgi:hypothetical protein
MIHILGVAGIWVKVAELTVFSRDYHRKNWNYTFSRGINEKLAGFTQLAGI